MTKKIAYQVAMACAHGRKAFDVVKATSEENAIEVLKASLPTNTQYVRFQARVMNYKV